MINAVYVMALSAAHACGYNPATATAATVLILLLSLSLVDALHDSRALRGRTAGAMSVAAGTTVLTFGVLTIVACGGLPA